MERIGIDVSEHNGKIDWDKVKAAGKIDFVMIRAGYGKGNVDAQYYNNIKGASGVGIPLGVYWFSYGYTEEMARAEARYCIDLIKTYKIIYPVSFDLEYDTVRYAQQKGVELNKTVATRMAVAFCQEIEAAGYKPMNYANLDYSKNMFGNVPYDLWYAQYASAPSIKGMEIWQNTSSGNVAGIAGKVDLNICYKDYENTAEGSITQSEDILIGVGAKGLTVTAGTLNVRSAPGGTIIGTLQKGNRLGCDRRRWVGSECWFHYADGWVSGRYLTGWIAEAKKWWFINEGFTYKKKEWQFIDDKWYYFDKDGWMMTGWIQEKDGKWYYLTESGAMAVGVYVKSADGNQYYWLSSGKKELGDTLPQGAWDEAWTTNAPNLSKWKVVK